MSLVKLSALLLGATLVLGMGATTLSADMKCGAGKCGSSMKTQQKKDKKCGDAKCGSKKEAKKTMKCGAGKCM